MAAQNWKLPDIYLLPISRHHTPISAESGECDHLTAYVHVGNAIAHQIGLGFAPTGTPQDTDPLVLAQLDISEQQYELVRTVIANEVQRMSSQMGI